MLIIILCLKGDANCFFVFVFNIMMFYANDDVADLLILSWFKPHPCSASLFVGLVQLLNFVWLRWEFVGRSATARWRRGRQGPVSPHGRQTEARPEFPSARAVFLGHVQTCIFSVFFLVLIVRQVKLKPLFFHMNKKRCSYYAPRELVRCTTQRQYLSSILHHTTLHGSAASDMLCNPMI